MWHRLFQHWEDHEHHTENVKAIQNRRKHLEMLRKLQTPVSKPVLSRLSDIIYRRSEKNVRPQAPVFAMTKVLGMNQVMNQNETIGQQMMPVDQSLHLQNFNQQGRTYVQPQGQTYVQPNQHLTQQQNLHQAVQASKHHNQLHLDSQKQQQQPLVQQPPPAVLTSVSSSQQYTHTPVRQVKAANFLVNSIFFLLLHIYCEFLNFSCLLKD